MCMLGVDDVWTLAVDVVFILLWLLLFLKRLKNPVLRQLSKANGYDWFLLYH